MINGKYVSAVIVAAGSGERMGGVAKPFIKLGGKTVFDIVLDTFIASDEIDEIVVVCKDIEAYSQAVAGKTTKKISFTQGGKTRMASVYCGVSATAKNTDIVAIHDCARPFVTCEIIKSVLEATLEHGAATACTKAIDTVKYVDIENNIVYTPDRKNLLYIQTPQCFLKSIYTASVAVGIKDGAQFTDETTLVEKAGFHVKYVECGRKNIKLTTAEDVIIAKAFIAASKKSGEK